VQEPVPDRFSDLLKQLSEAESTQGKKARSATDEEPQT
jgi:anti-sigma factor NepR-like protein